MKYQINLKGHIVEYELQRKNVKNLNLRVKSNQTIYVSASESIPVEMIEEFLQSRADYILTALNHYAQIERYTPKPKQYVDGESIRFLGRDMRLMVTKEQKNAVESDGVTIRLAVTDPLDLILKRRTMDRWTRRQCQETIRSICDTIYPIFQKYGIAYPELRFRNMVSRWGSCQPKQGVLTFNYLLIEAPYSCVEYVVMHEFTHFLFPNHSRLFYEQLSTFMPDWRERKRVLEHEYAYSE